MKERLDILVMENGFAQSREKAKAIIMAGEIFVNGQKEDKAGMKFPTDAEITWKGNPIPFVGRGGLKLAKAVDVFALHLEGDVCMDVGASTGGFTDCMLQNGAAKVYSVDVGKGQLAWKLREDPRVVCMEKTNIRYVVQEDIEELPAFVSIDVSFISLTKVLTPVRELMTEDGRIVCLIKPQFEAGREKVGKKGVVREPEVHEEVIYAVALYAQSIGFRILGLDYSPIKGPEGNIEYLIYMQKNTSTKAVIAADASGESAMEGMKTDASVHDELNDAADQKAADTEEEALEAIPPERMPELIKATVKKAHEQLRSK